MKRKDGSIYSCEVYKCCIYGALDTLPTKVKRKISNISTHKNRRNPLKTGFKIENIGYGEYFGFAVNSNHLFLLEDGTVVHNTTEANIFDRHEVIRYCLLDEEGNIIGKALYSSTVEKLDSEKDGVQDAAKHLWNASDQNKREENGLTQSGLYRFFQTSDEGRNFDIYGYSDVEKTIKDILADRKSVENSPRALMARMRKEPRTIQEAFSIDDADCPFNAININTQIQCLTDEQKYLRRVWFYRDAETNVVKWRDDKNGFWQIFEFPEIPNKHKFENQFYEIAVAIPTLSYISTNIFYMRD